MRGLAASLSNAALFVHTDDERGWLVFSFEPEPHDSSIKCTITDRKGIDRRVPARMLTAHNMQLITDDFRPYFWIRSPDLVAAIGQVIGIFAKRYIPEAPEFWYYTQDHPKVEFCVQGCAPESPDELELTCSTWRDKEYSTKVMRGFEAVLRDNKLCVPDSIRHRDRTFHVTLTEAAAEQPLASFQELVNLHLEYLAEVPTVPPEP